MNNKVFIIVEVPLIEAKYEVYATKKDAAIYSK